MKKIILLFLIISFGFLGNSEFVLAQENSIEINFFYSTTCPHCKSEEEFLKELAPKYPEVKFNQYEVTGSRENQELLKTFYEKYEVPEREQGYVPVIFTPDKYFIGFSDKLSVALAISCLPSCS